MCAFSANASLQLRLSAVLCSQLTDPSIHPSIRGRGSTRRPGTKNRTFSNPVPRPSRLLVLWHAYILYPLPADKFRPLALSTPLVVSTPPYLPRHPYVMPRGKLDDLTTTTAATHDDGKVGRGCLDHGGAAAPTSRRWWATARWALLSFVLSLAVLPVFLPLSPSDPNAAAPSSSAAAAATLFGPHDFQHLHADELEAFGVFEQLGADAPGEQVAQCQRAVAREWARLSRTWHPDTCRYAGFMESWQCAAMYRMVQEKRPGDLADCLSVEMQSQ